MATKTRNIGEEVLQAIRDIKAGRGKRTIVFRPNDVARVREKLKITQSQLATIVGVSVRTLREWEQGRRRPKGAAVAFLAIASARPDVVQDVLRIAN